MLRHNAIRRRRTVRIATVGYAGVALDDLIAVLTQAGINTLVDVRQLPLSRRPGFSKTRLSLALQESGIRYVHLRALGNPKEHRRRYHAGDVAAGARGYRLHIVRHGGDAMGQLANAVASSACCLLCVEADPDQCHRTVITDLLRKEMPALVVEHLAVTQSAMRRTA